MPELLLYVGSVRFTSASLNLQIQQKKTNGGSAAVYLYYSLVCGPVVEAVDGSGKVT